MVKTKSLKKRQQIDSAHRNMFIAVAVTAFVVGSSLVASALMVNRILFYNQVIAEQNKTYETLVKNNQNLDKLAASVRGLEVNDNLASVNLGGKSSLSVVLDALPALGNSTALGASLKEKILSVPGVIIEHIAVDGTPEETDSKNQTGTLQNFSGIQIGQITFTFRVNGSASLLSQVLKNVEKSIRPISVDMVRFEASMDEKKSTMIVAGRSFYEPMQEVKLKTKVIKSKK